MQTSFLEAVVNRRHAILGRALHDFCIADALALIIAGNPLWTNERAPARADLEEAVLA